MLRFFDQIGEPCPEDGAGRPPGSVGVVFEGYLVFSFPAFSDGDQVGGGYEGEHEAGFAWGF